MPTPLLNITSATVERGATTILRDLSWRIDPGQHWIVFGPNGAGKTTLLNLVLGYLWPTSGRIEVLGETLGEVDVRELRPHIAVVSEHVKNLVNEEISGFEAILTGPRAHLNLYDDPSQDELARAMQISRSMALPPSILDRPYIVLSTGERQRVLIARALMTQPRILILDEPCAGLDLAGREFVLQTIRRVAALPEAPCIILTTHHVEEITPDFTHALLLQKGGAAATGRIEEVFTAESLSELFGLPIRLTRVEGRYSASAL